MCCKTRSNSVVHYGPITALVLIAVITVSTVFCIDNMMPMKTSTGMVVMAQFLGIVFGILLSFFLALYKGGGEIPLGWHPKTKEEEKSLQFCKICDGFKPPRSHHDHVSGHCIAKMDHYCPWINSAVGNRNHGEFLAFVTLVPLGCMYATGIQLVWLWHFMVPPKQWRQLAFYNPDHFNAMIYTIFGAACSVAVGIAVGALGIFQWMGVLSNMTQIEEWIVEKAEARPREEPFIFPYNLGRVANVGEVFQRWYSGDGIEWTVREGAHKYTFTEEQLAQKALKRAKTKTFKIAVGNSRWFRGFEFGFWVWWSSPWPLEPRIVVKTGEYVKAWTYSGDWLYGEVVTMTADNKFTSVKPRKRGWFPEPCIVDEDDVSDDSDDEIVTDFGCTGATDPGSILDNDTRQGETKKKI